MSVAKLLDSYRALNGEELARDGEEQHIGRAEPLGNGIPTLARNSYRDASRQGADRFSFAGRWEPAWLRQSWLGLSDMARVWKDRGIRKQVAIRRENWPDSAVGTHDDRSVSLFGIDRLDDTETYLVWGSRGEPSVYVYTTSAETHYPSLAAFLKEIVAVTRVGLKSPKFYGSFKEALAEADRVEILGVRVPSKRAKIPDFRCFPRLRTLSLSGTIGHWTEIPASILACSTLRALTLCDTSIEALPNELGDLRKLQHLYVVNNRLRTLPASIGRLEKLESLICGNNDITKLPTAVGRLGRLEKLNCACNHLTCVPTQIGKLKRLRELDLSQNELTSVPKSIGDLHQLETIDLQDNKLRRAPLALLDLPRVKTVLTDFDAVFVR